MQNNDLAIADTNASSLTNILRSLSMLEKCFDRLVRKNYHRRSQYPGIVIEIESALKTLRSWVKKFGIFCGTDAFNRAFGLWSETIGNLIADLVTECSPVNGKKQTKKYRLICEQQNLRKSIKNMLNHIKEYIRELQPVVTSVSVEIEKALIKKLAMPCSVADEQKPKPAVSERGRKTYIFPCSDKEYYLILVKDKMKFRTEVVNRLGDYGQFRGHKASCKGDPGYRLRGFRQSARKPIEEGGKQGCYPIRMVECCCCGEKFSILPSFLPREKNHSINIIGNVLRGILLFGQSLSAAFESTALTGRKLKSRQTLLNWIEWLGAYHPAAILTRAGVKGSGYLQEDEGFEKEPDLRTYTVAMVDSESLLVWHMDYVDRVDEETLCSSFEKFMEQIDFKILGVTKDKWKASTNALKAIFKKVWIGFCHRHCLKKFRQALSEYQKDNKISNKEVKRLYAEFKMAMETASSGVGLKVKIESLLMQEHAFCHSLFRPVIEEIKKNAVRYTVNKKRSGIKKTTSLVDNFLKIVKRKLRQSESFRDRRMTGILFRAMANLRNFVPFMSGAKNMHKSPFMLAQGETYDLPWIQAMNVHNAFLFTDIAS